MEFNIKNILFSKFFGLIVILSAVPSDALNDRPIIGVLAQLSFDPIKNYGNTYIAASYIKFLESAGARVVPILINQSDEYYQKMFNSLNGVLFPGGGGDDLTTSGYGISGKHFYDLAIKNYDERRDHFPIWGTCLGFELLTMLTANNKNLLASTDAVGISYPLIFTKDFQDSRLFGQTDPSILKILSSENVTYNSHHWGLTPTNFSQSTALKSFYRVLSTDVDRKGLRFISTIEAMDYPIYAVQFHPEKNSFEWEIATIIHTPDAIKIGQYFANFMVGEARKNYHKFSSQAEELSYVIFNHPPIYTGNVTTFEQCYFFDI